MTKISRSEVRAILFADDCDIKLNATDRENRAQDILETASFISFLISSELIELFLTPLLHKFFIYLILS